MHIVHMYIHFVHVLHVHVHIYLFPAAHPPSVYTVYKLYTFPDHASSTSSPSTHPTLNDTHTFPVTMDTLLHHYLSSQVSTHRMREVAHVCVGEEVGVHCTVYILGTGTYDSSLSS